MADLTGVNYTDYEETSFEPVPAGTYVIGLESSEMKTTKKGDGQYLKCTFQILDGEYKNRKVFMNFNMVNPSQTAQNIGLSQFAALCKATGVLQPTDSCQLNDIPVKAKVKVIKNTYNGEEKMVNEISDFMPNTATATSPAATSTDSPFA